MSLLDNLPKQFDFQVSKQLMKLKEKQNLSVYIVSDTHFSDKESTVHLNYFRHCIDFCNDTTTRIRERKPDIIILLGDIFGRHKEKNLEQRESLSIFTRYFQTWSQMVNGLLFTVVGNHDIAPTLTDAEYLSQIGILKRFDEIDLPNLKIHCLNYGEAHREVSIDKSKYNVVLGHDEYIIEGHTDWFFVSKKAISLRTLTNIKGADLLISGHIHKPSKKVNTTTIDGEEIKLFYPGCALEPSRDKTMPDTTYDVLLEEIDGVVKFTRIPIKLKPREELFRELLTEKDIAEAIYEIETKENDEGNKRSIQELSSILEKINDMSLFDDTSVENQIKLMGRDNPQAVELALKTIKEVEE